MDLMAINSIWIELNLLSLIFVVHIIWFWGIFLVGLWRIWILLGKLRLRRLFSLLNLGLLLRGSILLGFRLGVLLLGLVLLIWRSIINFLTYLSRFLHHIWELSKSRTVLLKQECKFFKNSEELKTSSNYFLILQVSPARKFRRWLKMKEMNRKTQIFVTYKNCLKILP